MTDNSSNSVIQKYLAKAWDSTIDYVAFPDVHGFRTEWVYFSLREVNRLESFAKQLVQALIEAGDLLSTEQGGVTWSVEADQALQKLRGVTELKDLPTRLTQAAKLQMHMVPDGLFDTFMSIRGREEFNVDHLHQLGEYGIYLNINSLRKEPDQDVWQGCGFEDIKPTDLRVRAEFEAGAIVEGKPVERVLATIKLQGGQTFRDRPHTNYYRIPAPVEHPDPEKNKYILVYEWEAGDGPTDSIIGNGLYYLGNTGLYVGQYNALEPHYITKWDALEVVTADE